MEDLLFERGVDICHETARLWWNRFGPMFAADIRPRKQDVNLGKAQQPGVAPDDPAASRAAKALLSMG
jgi:hypothetical protein